MSKLPLIHGLLSSIEDIEYGNSVNMGLLDHIHMGSAINPMAALQYGPPHTEALGLTSTSRAAKESPMVKL